MDLQIRSFSNELVDVINGNPLPMEVKRLVLAEVLGKVSAEANRLVAEQQKILFGGNKDELSENAVEE